ncbi:MAG: DEAD/DEAH box helicase [Acidobacteriota bacterium]|nr:DEAD/DEAH box helicase [Acidobacteriota bacterium]
MASDPSTTLPARRTQAGVPDARTLRVGVEEHKQVALQNALQVLASGSAIDRPDTPDEVVTAVRRLPAVEAAYAAFPDAIDPRLRAAFESRGVRQLYTHQAEAFTHVAAGRNIVVTTPTASGKTLCYNLPVLDRILKQPSTRALYLFPTKALAQDQMAELHELVGAIGEVGEPIGVHTYDGDTPQDARRTIRTRAHVVMSNPDMVHSGILPHHPRWAKLFENLQYVVIDELHAYRGVFGSHLANVLRRLQRICRHYGSNPQFICSSATIANPAQLAERLAERSFALVEKSGAPRGEKYFVFVNPPVVNRELGIRRSYIAESRRVAGEFLRRNLQVIVFAQSRLSTEILTTYLKEDFEDSPGMPERIRGYRGGYLPLRRREIEKGLRAGQVRGVISTNALELGIDIGALDVSVMAGYPGTIASTWQRAGRAGRRSGQSAAVMVSSSSPIDQFVVRHPSYFFDASPEHALVNPDNLHILVDHVKCAAFELPFTTEETYGQVNVQDVLGVLQESGLVHKSGAENDAGQWNWTSESYPANAVSLRSISSDNFVITDHTAGPKVIGETDFTSALSTLHPKAIYMVEGKIYQVEELDFVGRKAHVREVNCDYYTTAITYTQVSILDRFEAADVALHGEVHVVSRVVGFKKIRFHTNENVGSGELDLPEQQMHTTSYWLEIPLAVMTALPYATDDRRDGVVGLAFAMKQVAQLLLMCDARDIGLSVNAGETDGDDTPRIFLYDAYPGGIGFSAPLWGMQQELLTRTRALIMGCDCDTGCPVCVGPIGETGPLAKIVALRLLDHLLGNAIDAGMAGTDLSAEALGATVEVPARHTDEVPF